MLTISVCVGTSCHVKGAYSIIDGLQTIIKQRNIGDKVTVNGAFCLGECTNPVSVKLDDNEEIFSVTENNLVDFFEQNVMPRI